MQKAVLNRQDRYAGASTGAADTKICGRSSAAVLASKSLYNNSHSGEIIGLAISVKYRILHLDSLMATQNFLVRKMAVPVAVQHRHSVPHFCRRHSRSRNQWLA